jgi:hypothetical protein
MSGVFPATFHVAANTLKASICVLAVEEGELKLLNFRLVLLKKDDDDADGEATSNSSGLSLKSTVLLIEPSGRCVDEEFLPLIPDILPKGDFLLLVFWSIF